jgi:hypothetical protein
MTEFCTLDKHRFGLINWTLKMQISDREIRNNPTIYKIHHPVTDISHREVV